MKQTREELVNELNSLREQQKKVRDKLDAFDYDEKFNKNSELVGRCFIESNIVNENSIDCVLVFGLEKETCNPLAIRIMYWKDNMFYFNIENYSYFSYNDSNYNWIEINKDIFMEHYQEVQKRILNALNKKD